MPKPKPEKGNDLFFADYSNTTGARMRAEKARKYPGDEVSNHYAPEAGIRSHQKNIRGPIVEYQTPVVQPVGYGHQTPAKKGLYDMSIYIDPNTIYRQKMNGTNFSDQETKGLSGAKGNGGFSQAPITSVAPVNNPASLKESFWAGREPLRPPSPPRFMLPK